MPERSLVWCAGRLVKNKWVSLFGLTGVKFGLIFPNKREQLSGFFYSVL